MKNFLNVIRLLFRSVVGTIHGVVIIFFILSAFSDRISPETSLFFSYLGLAFPVFCVLNLCFVFYWIFLWEWRFVLIGLCSFLLCKGAVTRYFPYNEKKEVVSNEHVLKVLTYNVMGFGYKDHSVTNPNPIIEYIANSDADIVCLQEYIVGTSKKYLTNKKVFNALKMYRYRSLIPLGSSSIAVFSKYPISKSRKIKYETVSNGSSIHELNINGKKLTLVNNHLESFKLTMEDKSNYSAFLKNMNTETLGGLKSSIEHKLGPAFKVRARQAEAVAEEIKNIETDYLLVCGDFNDTPISYVYRTMRGSLKDAFVESGRGPGVSYNENFYFFRIDNILHSDNMIPMNCTVDKVRYSDHYPVWCYLEMKSPKE
ncbi:MAG: endonuclease/exonuclease/phosphatase family protein [Parabacteroides sp.]|nr:endonuclease/exonuclease/phosphatase family protein [Parabacteroides sp.]